MKHKIIDGLQIIAAIVLTTGIAYAMPVQQLNDAKPVAQHSEVQQAPATETKPVETPVVTPDPVVAAQTAVAPQPVVETPVAPSIPAYTPSGNKQVWLEQSGIPAEYWDEVDWIVTRESSWDPCSYYPSQSDCSATPVNACGLVMQNPCNKIGGDWRDPVAALKWQYSYVTQRYGGYPQAVQHWIANGNY